MWFFLLCFLKRIYPFGLLWAICLFLINDAFYRLCSKPSNEHSYQIWFQLAQWFQRRILNCKLFECELSVERTINKTNTYVGLEMAIVPLLEWEWFYMLYLSTLARFSKVTKVNEFPKARFKFMYMRNGRIKRYCHHLHPSTPVTNFYICIKRTS
jgi:hypothetical protein